MSVKAGRKQKIKEYVDVAKANILEIGALDSPTFSPKKYSVEFVDFASRKELARKSSHNPRYTIKNLVNVDYVIPDGKYSEHITKTFDLIIGNHVIEHIPDTIRWLEQLHSLLNQKGILFLAIPDKRYTFDIARRNTNFIDLLRNYREKIEKPDFYHILEHFYYHKNISAKEVWDKADYSDKVRQQRFSPNDALKHAQKHADEAYADVHCHVYTSDSFQEILHILQDLNLISFSIRNITHPLVDSNEFHVVLEK